MSTNIIPRNRDEQLRHLIRRAGYGFSLEDLHDARHKGWRLWLEEQLSPNFNDDKYGNMVRQMFPRAGWTIQQIHDEVAIHPDRKFGWSYMMQVSFRSLGLQCFSRWQVFEQAVDFYANHLNVTCPSSGVWDSRGEYDTFVIRQHTFGKFPAMLEASAFHPSMLRYLNNDENRKGKPNENYAREILELHTVGVGPFSENDVKELAVLLTGWRVHHETGQAYFDFRRHDPRAVKVMGKTWPTRTASSAEQVQRQFVRWVAALPETATYLCRKLCVKYVSDEPPQSLVNELAKTWRATGGDTRKVLRQLFCSPQFWASTGKKVRRPTEDMSATLRALGLKDPRPDLADHNSKHEYMPRTSVMDLYWMNAGSGHNPLRWPTPDGYDDKATGWQSAGAQTRLWSDHGALAAGFWPRRLGIDPWDQNRDDPAHAALKRTRNARADRRYGTASPKTYRDWINATTDALGMARLSERDVKALTDMSKRSNDSRPKTPDTVINGYEPTREWAYRNITAQVLNSPAFRVR